MSICVYIFTESLSSNQCLNETENFKGHFLAVRHRPYAKLKHTLIKLPAVLISIPRAWLTAVYFRLPGISSDHEKHLCTLLAGFVLRSRSFVGKLNGKESFKQRYSVIKKKKKNESNYLKMLPFAARVCSIYRKSLRGCVTIELPVSWSLHVRILPAEQDIYRESNLQSFITM